MVAGAAFAAFTGAFVTAPFIAGGMAVTPQPPRPLAMTAKTPDTIAVVVHRDPFSGPPEALPPHTTMQVAYPTAPPFSVRSPVPGVSGGSLLMSMPPTPRFPRATPPPPHVTAIVTGPHPVALVDLRGTMRVVGVGDRIAGATVVGIDFSGVRLTNGTTLRMVTRE